MKKADLQLSLQVGSVEAAGHVIFGFLGASQTDCFLFYSIGLRKYNPRRCS